MRYLKSYKSYTESIHIDVDMDYNFSDILESLSIFQDNLLTSIKAEGVDFEEEFDYNLKNKEMDLEILGETSGFVTALQNKGLKASGVENTDDYETFVSREMKFLLIRRENANELMNPKYIVIQNRDDSKNKWGELKLYKVHDDIKKFYDTLSSKTIELKHNNKNYIYTTSNSGNEWNLQNIKDADDTFPKYMRKDDLRNLIENNRDIKITIV